jgi:CubicO group peptidase (beta-lactamase class C family)
MTRRIRLCLLASLTAAALVVPIITGVVAPAHAATFEGYHDATAATHQANFDRLSGAGYRMTSLTMTGTPSAPLYAAVWVKRSGPAWAAVHGVSATDYNSWSSSMHDQGYRLRLFTGVGGTLSQARFAAVMEKSTDSTYVSPVGNGTQLRTSMDDALAHGFIPQAIAAFGTSASPLFAVVFRPNVKGIWGSGTGATPWWYSTDLSASDFQSQFNAQTAAGVRPAMIVLSAAGRYTVVWHDTAVNAWSARAGLTSAQYQTAFTDAGNNGAFPIYLSAFGAGSNERFNAIFAPSDSIRPRAFAMTGATNSALAGFDTYVRNLMKSTNARAGQLAVVKEGKLAYARGFTWAEAGYPATSATSLFRTASCSKPLTSIAIHQLMTPPPRGVAPLTETTPIKSLLGVTQPDGSAPADSRWSDVKLDQLLVHTGGWDRDKTRDPQFNDLAVAAAFTNQLPVTKPQILKKTASVALDFPPGSETHYSNFGFSLLGQAIEKVRGKNYTTSVKETVFTPLGLSRPTLGKSLIGNRAAGEVRYHPTTPSLSQSVLSTSRPWVATQYGGFNHENFDSHGGWIMSAPDWAKVLAAFDLGSANPILNSAMTDHMWTNPIPALNKKQLRGWFLQGLKDAAGNAVKGYWHNGSIAGDACFVMHTSNNLDFVLLLNTDVPRFLSGAVDGAALNNIANNVTTWPTTDLFPSMGIASFS